MKIKSFLKDMPLLHDLKLSYKKKYIFVWFSFYGTLFVYLAFLCRKKLEYNQANVPPPTFLEDTLNVWVLKYSITKMFSLLQLRHHPTSFINLENLSIILKHDSIIFKYNYQSIVSSESTVRLHRDPPSPIMAYLDLAVLGQLGFNDSSKCTMND